MRSSSATCARRARWPERLAAFAAACALLPAAAQAQPVDVLVCAGCHGSSGEGRQAVGYPPIAGQPQAYLSRQLEAFADGRRQSAIMGPVARWLAPADRERMAAHFSRVAADDARPLDGALGRGRILDERGDNELRVQACANCHGRGGRGMPPFGARLAALPRAYIAAQLRAFRDGSRRTDPSGAMALIARNLPEADIEALAAHYGDR